MIQSRRDVLKAGGGASLLALLAAAGFAPEAALAADLSQKAFDAKTMKDTFDAMGAGSRADSPLIAMSAPEIAENGAVVPIGVNSKVPGTESIAILVAKNPNPLVASFDIPAGTEPAVSTRVKMAESSDVYVLVRAQGKYFTTKKEIKVTIGGCGG